VLSHAEALLDCFKESSIFGWGCKEQHKAFWDCYRHERVGILAFVVVNDPPNECHVTPCLLQIQGMDANVVGDALSRWVDKVKPSRGQSTAKDH